MRAGPSGQALNLTGKAKAIMAIGLGATGKTTLLRWLERALERGEDELALATVDPVNRELGHYFPATGATHAGSGTVTAWLEQLLAMILETGKSAALDFGGGDTTLPAPNGGARSSADDGKRRRRARRTLSADAPQQRPDTACGDDEVGFRPKATALILNEGRADSTRAPLQEFGQIRRHSSLQISHRAGRGRNLDAPPLCGQGH